MPKSRRSRKRRPASKGKGRGFYFMFGGEPGAWEPEDGPIEDAVNARDRATFEADPGLVSFVRPPAPGELRATIPAGCDLVGVEVLQIRPGLRVRIPQFRRLEPNEIQ